MSFSSLLLIDLKRIKKASPNPSTIKNKTTKKGKTSTATAIITAEYFAYDWNALKNTTSLKFTNIIENAAIGRDISFLISQYIDVTIGKEYAPTSINNWKKINSCFFLYEIFYINYLPNKFPGSLI